MNFLPVLLSVMGVLVGRKVATTVGTCPHRGKVWGAFSLPLVTLALGPVWVPAAFTASLTAALAAGLTAHGSLSKTVLTTALASSLGAALLTVW